MIDLDDYPVVTENSESFLNHRQLLDYRSEREECLQWLLTYGKEPDKAEGYAKGSVKPRSYRMDRFYRFVWKLEGGYTVDLTHDHADEWMDHLAHRDVSAIHQLTKGVFQPWIGQRLQRPQSLTGARTPGRRVRLAPLHQPEHRGRIRPVDRQ